MIVFGLNAVLKLSGIKGMSWLIVDEYELFKKRLGEIEMDSVVKGCLNISEVK